MGIQYNLTMKTSILSVIFGLLLLSGTSLDCPVNPETQLLSDTVGLNSISNQNSLNPQNMVFNYQYTKSWTSTPNVAIGLNEISADESPYLEISITTAKVTPSGIYFQAQSGSQSSWKSFQINFMASSRSDIEIGTAFANSPSVARDGTFNVVYNMNQDTDSTSLKVKSFMSGISLESLDRQQFGLRQQSTNTIGQTIYFSFANLQQKSIVRSLTLSVVIFNVRTPGLLYADGTIEQNFVVSTTSVTIPRHGINELRTYIVGINTFDLSAAAPVSISSAIDETFTLVVGPIDRNQINFVSVSYLIFSVVDCGSCSGFPLLFEGLCIHTCPEGYNKIGGICIPQACTQGYEMVNGACLLKCSTNQVLSGDVCVCAPGFNLINEVCDKCKDGFFFDYKKVSCQPLCTFNSYFSNGRCFCNAGYNLIGGVCNQCPYGSAYDEVTQNCYNICTAVNEVYSPAGCVCKNGFNKIKGVCARCPYQTTFDPRTGACECMYGKENVNGMCMTPCEANKIRSANGDCVCAPKFFVFRDGTCGQCDDARSYYDTVTKSCVCTPPYMKIAGTCQPVCPRNWIYDNKSQTCLELCKQFNQIIVNGQCVCTPGFIRNAAGICLADCRPMQNRNPVTGACTCQAGTVRNVLGGCDVISCPHGYSWHVGRQDCLSSCKPNQVFINDACQCVSGTELSPYGDCAPECSHFEINVNGFCQCPNPNDIRVEFGVCIPQCPPNTAPDASGVCKCAKLCNGLRNYAQPFCSLGQDYIPETNSCRCNAPKVWIFGQCATPSKCPANAYWCGTSCVCLTGFFMVKGVCTPVVPELICPSDSTSNGVNCQCNPGFYPIVPGTCTKCGPGTLWNGQFCGLVLDGCTNGSVYDWNLRTCVLIVPNCDAGQYWDGISCRCNTGTFWINSACTVCAPGTFFDGLACTPGTNGGQCTDPYSFFNGESCVCLPGYWPLNAGKCITCPVGTNWDGTCCKLNEGVTLPLTGI